MAVERIREFALDLEDVVKTRFDGFVNSQKRIRAVQETEFERRILEEGLSYQSQSDYRKGQLEDEKEKTYPNLDYIEDLKTDVSTLRKFIRYERLRNDYLESYTRFREGKITIDNLITFLNGQLEGETDPVLRGEMTKSLSSARTEKVTIENSILENRFTLARTDKSIDLIDKVLNEIEAKRSEASRVGDMETVTAMDIRLQVLNKERQQIVVTDKIHDFELSVIGQGSTSSQKLDLLNNAITMADGENPITINQTRWGSEIEYWTAIRDQYISGVGGGEFKSFFDEFNEEIGNNITKLQTMNKWGYIPMSSAEAIDKDFTNLLQKPEFQPYISLVENYRLTSLIDITGKIANAVMDEAEFYGEYDKGFTALKNIQAKFGIDMSSYIGSLYYNQITSIPTKEAGLRRTAEILAEQRGTTVEEEFQKLLISPVEEREPPIFEETIDVPALEKRKSEVEKQIEEAKKKIEEAQKAKAEGKPVTPPTPAPAPTGEQVHQTWTRITGKPWSAARAGGHTTGSSEANIALQQKLLGGWNPYAEPTPTTPPTPSAPAFDPASYATEKGYTKYFQKGGQWYGAKAGVWQTAESKEKAREMAGLT